MPIKLIILGVFVIGVTIGSVVANSNGSSKGTGGCNLLGGIPSETAADTPGSTQDASADSGANGSDQSSGDTSGSTGGTDATGTGSGTTGGNDSSGGDSGSGSSGDTGTGNGSGDSSGDGSGGTSGGTDNGNGGGDGGGDTSPGTPAITGQYRGTLTVTDTQSLSDTPGTPRTTTMNEAITFTDTPRPDGVTILNYTSNPNLRTTALQVGEQDTLTETASGMDITLGVRVTEATYTSTTARIQYALTFNAHGGNLVQSGTGSQLVNASLDADGNLAYSVSTQYSVRLTAGSIVFNTTETKDATGTLLRQTGQGSSSGSGDGSQ